MTLLASTVYAEPPGDDDPAEGYHEASKLSRATAAWAMRGSARMAADADLRRAAARATRRRAQYPSRTLPIPPPLDVPLERALRERRSARAFGVRQLAAAELAAILRAGYGPTGVLRTESGPLQSLRAAPSAGGLYPLELFVAPFDVERFGRAVHQYDPLHDALIRLPVRADALAGTTPYEELVRTAAAVVVIAATFWRSRAKYGSRAYRFTLLEAGHVAQNILLACAALDLAALPLGGFYDRELDALLELDGVDESVLYAICIGAREEPA